MFQENKPIFIFFVVFFLVAGVGIAFWKLRIESPAVPVAPPSPAVSSSLSSPQEKEKIAPVAPKNPVSSPNPFTGTALYSGRDPEEVRPVPDAVRLFNDEQRNAIYSNIQTQGRAVRSNPSFFTGWIELGLLKKIIGDYAGARDAWEYASILQPKNSLSFANLGELYWHYLPDFKKSEANLLISIQHKPEDIQTHITLAELYHYSYTEKHDRAPQVLLDGISLNPGNGTLMRRLAYLYEQREEWAEALSWWQKVLAQHPDESEVQDKVSGLKQKIGDK